MHATLHITDPWRCAQDLRTAAKIVSEHGWTQQRLQNRIGQVCAIGALNLAAGASSASLSASDLCHPDLFNLVERRNDMVRALDAVITISDDTLIQARIPSAFLTSSPEMRLVLWNDHVCDGGPQLEHVLLTAADMVENECDH